MSYDVSPVGSAGSLVGASLETAGHYMQSAMLDLMSSGMGNALGVLFYVIAGMSAFFIVAIGGHYKFGLWFFVGPALFFWMINDRVVSDGASWEFGYRAYKQEPVEELTSWTKSSDRFERVRTQNGEEIWVRRMDTVAKREMKVSRVFAFWNEFTSRVVQQLVGLMNLTSSETDLDFVVKAQKWELLRNAKPISPDLLLFTNLTTVAECRPYYIALSGALNPAYSEERKAEFQQALNSHLDAKTFDLVNYPALFRWLQTPHYGKTFIDPSLTRRETNCKELWSFAAQLMRLDADNVLSLLLEIDVPVDELTPQQLAAYKSAEKDKLFKRFKYRPRDLNGNEIPDGPTMDQKFTDEQKVEFIINELAARMLLSQLRVMNPVFQQSAQIADQPVMYNPDMQAEADVSRSLKMMIAGGEEWQGKGDFLGAMLAMPYLQGLVLYFLAMSFPFFALALVIPGRHTSFLTWMSLWFWVKSWDVGFALVMLVEKLLYAILPQSPTLSKEALENSDVMFGQVFNELIKVDPTFSVGTYYSIIAALLFAVPVISGLVVKHGAGELASAVNQGFHNFSGKIGGSMNAFESNALSNASLAQAHRNVIAAAEGGKTRALMDPEVVGNGFEKTKAAMLQKGKIKDFDSLPGFAGLVNDLSKGTQEQLVKYKKGMALAKFDQNIATITFNESMSEENLLRASEAVMLKWNSHDIALDYPGKQMLGVLKSRVNFNYASLADKQLDKLLYEGVGSVMNSLKEPKKGALPGPSTLTHP